MVTVDVCILSKLRASGIKSRALEQFESQQSFFFFFKTRWSNKICTHICVCIHAYVHLVVIYGVIKAHKPARVINCNVCTVLPKK